MPWGEAVSLHGCFVFIGVRKKKHKYCYGTLYKKTKKLSENTVVEMMLKLCLHRYRLHLLDAALVFDVGVKFDLITVLSLITALSENCLCRLYVTLFLIFSQFVISLCFKLQVLQLKRCFTHSENNSNNWVLTILWNLTKRYSFSHLCGCTFT